MTANTNTKISTASVGEATTETTTVPAQAIVVVVPAQQQHPVSQQQFEFDGQPAHVVTFMGHHLCECGSSGGCSVSGLNLCELLCIIICLCTSIIISALIALAIWFWHYMTNQGY